MELTLARLTDPRLRPLVEETRDFYARRTAGRGPRNLQELHTVRAGLPAPPPCEPPPQVLELVGAGGEVVPLRIHAPADTPATGVVLDMHGGGFYMGSAAASDQRNRRLAGALGVVVASVDYRLAPEHPWPAAPADCETAALWLLEHGQKRFGTERLGIVGFSAGATLAMTTLLRLRDRGVTGVDTGVLQFGTYDLSGLTPAGRRFSDEYFLEAYVGAAPDRTHPDVSPVYAELAGLPPLLMVVGEEDILLEDNLAMAARLSAAGVEVDLRLYPSAPHGFTGHPTPMARAALDDVETWLRQRLT